MTNDIVEMLERMMALCEDMAAQSRDAAYLNEGRGLGRRLHLQARAEENDTHALRALRDAIVRDRHAYAQWLAVAYGTTSEGAEPDTYDEREQDAWDEHEYATNALLVLCREVTP